MSIQQAPVIKKTLEDIPEIMELVNHNYPHIFLKQAIEGVSYPFIIMAFQYGGERYETRTRYFDTYWRILGYTKKMNTAIKLAEAISKLSLKIPVIPVGSRFCPVGTIQENMPVFETDIIQNTLIYAAGGVYRFRLIIED